MSAIAHVAAPLFAIIAAGALAGRAGLMGEAAGAALNRFVFLFAMPAAVFRFAATNAPPGPEAASIGLAYLIAISAVLGGSFFFAKAVFKLTVREAGAHAFASSLANAVFLGLPIALSIEGWGASYLVLMLIEGTLVLTAGAALMTWPEDGGPAKLSAQVGGTLLRVARNPVVAGTLLGFAWSLAGLPLAGPPERFLHYLGGAAGPAALFSLGLVLAAPRAAPEPGQTRAIASIVLGKIALLPALTLGLAWAFGAGPRDLGVAALFTSLPTGVNAYVQAAHYGVYVRRTAAALTATTALSLGTVSAALFVFG